MRVTDKGALVCDSEGSTGTFINEARIVEQALNSGDVLRVGKTRLLFTVGNVGKQIVAATEIASTDEHMRPGDKPLTQLTGSVLSRYEIRSILGEGKIGVVFQARDTDDQRIVALKVLKPSFSGSEPEKQRFIRAMKTMLPLEHRNLVGIYNAGKTGAYCWVAMEYVPGKSLAEIIERISTNAVKPIKKAWAGSSGGSRGWWMPALRSAIHLSRALHFAHQHHIVHRNITPRNILVRDNDKFTKLGDLMLAKALEGPLAKSVTRTGELLGDLQYMSPERTHGTNRLDGRSDIYSLGASVYALLAGRPPFVEKSRKELIASIRSAEPKRPSEFQPTIPEEFEEALLKMLAKRPEDRFQTPAHLLVPLERIAEKHGITV
jgi:serine/threonine-protein kinase